jgi:Uma2 family endonuclease
MPEHVRAELIEGIVYMASPLRNTAHGQPHGMIMTWLGTYFAQTPGTSFGDNCTVLLDADNEVQPDALLRIEEQAGGRCKITPDDFLSGPPEFIFEIAASSASYDLHEKREAYRRNGVQEYAVWRTEDNAIDWWQLIEGDYHPIPADATHCVHSQVFPGLVLNTAALLEGRLADVLGSLTTNLRSPEHQAFKASLAAQSVQAETRP